MSGVARALAWAALAMGAAAQALAQAPAGMSGLADSALAARVNALARAGRWEAAAALVAPLATDSAGRAKYARLSLEAGVAAWRASDRAAARRDWERARRADPSLEGAWVNLAVLFAAGGEADSASAVAERGLTVHPRSGRLRLILADAEAARGRWTAAADDYRRAAPLLPRREEAELPLLSVLVAGKDTAAALALGRELAERPATRRARLVVADVADSLGATALADTIYRALLVRDSLDLDALDAAARLAERQGDTARAVALRTREAGIDSSGAAAPLALLRLTAPGPDGAATLLRRGLWHGMAALERIELALTGAGLSSDALEGPAGPLVAGRARRERAALLAILDRAVLGEPWGPAELGALQLAWPGSALLERYAARLAERRGDDAAALASVDHLLRASPDDAELQRARARLLERAGRSAEAALALARALDLAPEDDSTFRALERLAEAGGALPDLLAQIRRLRIRLPDSHLLADHETEVVERLGAHGASPASAPEGGWQ